MYKQIIAIVFVLSISANLLAQEYQYIPFPDSGVVWSEIYYSFSENAIDETAYECFALNGEDTTINGHMYTKVYHFYDSIFDKTKAVCVGGIREDSLKRVYYNGQQAHRLKPQLQYAKPGDEIILFDFGIEEGDTIKYIINSSAPGDAVYIVSKIKYINIGGILRKQFFFMNYEDDFWGFSWIEGIGSTKGLLFVSGDTPMTYNNQLICFFENDDQTYHNTEYKDCFEGFVEIDEMKIKNKVSLSPNPAINKEITFNFNGIRFEKVLIYNNNGSLIGSFPVKTFESLTILLPKTAPGIHYYKALTSNGKYALGKFIIQ